jgi:hypothetical protein
MWVMPQRGRPPTHDPGEPPRRYAWREGKKTVSAPVTLEQWRTLRNVATKTDRSHTDLIIEALDDLAVKYGEQPQPPTGNGVARAMPRPARVAALADRALTGWTPTLDDVQAVLDFMREHGLPGEPRTREIEQKIKTGAALTSADTFWIEWFLPPVTQKRIDPRLAPSPHFWAFPRRARAVTPERLSTGLFPDFGDRRDQHLVSGAAK